MFFFSLSNEFPYVFKIQAVEPPKRRIWLRDVPTQGGCLLVAGVSSSEVYEVSSIVHMMVSSQELFEFPDITG